MWEIEESNEYDFIYIYCKPTKYVGPTVLQYLFSIFYSRSINLPFGCLKAKKNSKNRRHSLMYVCNTVNFSWQSKAKFSYSNICEKRKEGETRAACWQNDVLSVSKTFSVGTPLSSVKKEKAHGERHGWCSRCEGSWKPGLLHASAKGKASNIK